MENLTKAYHFAAQKHTKQRRKNTEASPYINHPIEVAKLLTEGGVQDQNVIIAGILHDTVEDTGTTYNELVNKFGKQIADIVIECSDDKNLSKIRRKELQIEHARAKSDEAKLVKLADKLSNLSDLYRDPPKNWSPEEIYGYFVWAYFVCREMIDTNDYLEIELWKIFEDQGILNRSEENLQSELQNYYTRIDKSE